MRGADEVAQTRLRAELESCEAKAAAERDAALRRAVAESKRRADTIRSQCMKEKAAAVAKLQNEHNQVVAEITEAARIERKNALDELSQRAKRELDHAVERVSQFTHTHMHTNFKIPRAHVFLNSFFGFTHNNHIARSPACKTGGSTYRCNKAGRRA